MRSLSTSHPIQRTDPKSGDNNINFEAEGKAERSQEVALGMLNKGYSVSDIRDITGLSEETIKDLKHSLS